jgi:hypothetical protein
MRHVSSPILTSLEEVHDRDVYGRGHAGHRPASAERRRRPRLRPRLRQGLANLGVPSRSPAPPTPSGPDGRYHRTPRHRERAEPGVCSALTLISRFWTAPPVERESQAPPALHLIPAAGQALRPRRQRIPARHLAGSPGQVDSVQRGQPDLVHRQRAQRPPVLTLGRVRGVHRLRGGRSRGRAGALPAARRLTIRPAPSREQELVCPLSRREALKHLS